RLAEAEKGPVPAERKGSGWPPHLTGGSFRLRIGVVEAGKVGSPSIRIYGFISSLSFPGRAGGPSHPRFPRPGHSHGKDPAPPDCELARGPAPGGHSENSFHWESGFSVGGPG